MLLSPRDRPTKMSWLFVQSEFAPVTSTLLLEEVLEEVL